MASGSGPPVTQDTHTRGEADRDHRAAEGFKDVLMSRGWWMRRDPVGMTKRRHPTHLMLDGGRAHIPDVDADAFLNEYALIVTRSFATPPRCAKPACVELRTPVFRLFMDVDARVLPEKVDDIDFSGMWSAIFQASADFFASVTRMVVCEAPVKIEPNAKKFGVHLVWPQVFVTPPMAMAFRATLLGRLPNRFGHPFVNSWEDVLDKCVYTSNGLRMPWSVKAKGDTRAYCPTKVVSSTDSVESVESVSPHITVSFVREWMKDLAIRAPGASPSQLCEGVAIPLDLRGGKENINPHASARRHDIEEHAAELGLIDEAIPPEYKPHAFTSVFVTPHCVMLRSTSHYCANLGREHRSNTVYFAVSSKGVTQRCFCRCETTDGRTYGMCKDFESAAFVGVPQSAIDSLVAMAEASNKAMRAREVAYEFAAMPSTKRVSAAGLGTVLGFGVKGRAGGFRGRREAAKKT